MIILRDKLFVAKNIIAGNPHKCAEFQGKGVLIELIKAIEFYDRQNNMKHWLLEEIVGKYFKEATAAGNLITDCLIRGEEREISSRRIGQVSSTGAEFVEEVFDLFAPGNEQYRKYASSYKNELDNLNLDVDTYKRVLKYISLVFAGQIDLDVDDFWSNKISTMKVDYNSTCPLNTEVTERTERLLLQCIVNIKRYSTPEMDRLLRNY